MKKFLYYTILYAIFQGIVNAQVSSYTFTQSTTATFSLNTGTGRNIIATATANTPASSLDDQVFLVSGFPFNFKFNGIDYTSCMVSTNGFITFGSTTPSATNYTPISSNEGYDGVISAFGGDINGVWNGGPGITSDLSWWVEGSAPNRAIVIQWRSFRPNKTFDDANIRILSFQIRLFETTNVVNIIYGFAATHGAAPHVTVPRQVGLRGFDHTDFNNRFNDNTMFFRSSVAGTSASATQLYSTEFNPPGVATISNSQALSYTWTPVNCVAPSSVISTGVTTTSATVSWTAPMNPPVNGYEYELRTSGAPGSGPSGLVNSGATFFTTVNFTGLTPNTTYFFYVRSDCSFNGFSTWESHSFTTSTMSVDDVNPSQHVQITLSSNFLQVRSPIKILRIQLISMEGKLLYDVQPHTFDFQHPVHLPTPYTVLVNYLLDNGINRSLKLLIR